MAEWYLPFSAFGKYDVYAWMTCVGTMTSQIARYQRLPYGTGGVVYSHYVNQGYYCDQWAPVTIGAPLYGNLGGQIRLTDNNGESPSRRIGADWMAFVATH